MVDGCVHDPWAAICSERPRCNSGAASMKPSMPGDGLGVIRLSGQRGWVKVRTGWALEHRSGCASIAGPHQPRLAWLRTAARAVRRS
jgi:hypothetical protein